MRARRASPAIARRTALIGDTAIALVGSVGTATGDGTAPTVPARNVITLNHVHEVGITGKGQAGYFQSLAYGNAVDANVMYNGPRAGVEFNDGYGGGYRVASNLLFGWSRESGGHAAFNAWDRVSYLALWEAGGGGGNSSSLNSS